MDETGLYVGFFLSELLNQQTLIFYRCVKLKRL